MAWPGKEIDYQAEFGVPDKQALLDRLNKVTSLETELTQNKTVLTTQESELNTVKATLSAIEERVKNLPTNTNNNNNNNNNNGVVEIPSVTEDENAAFAARMSPLYANQMSTTAMVIEDRVMRQLSTSDPRFTKFEKEVREMLNNTPLQMRANTNINPATKRTYAEDIVNNAYLIVKGRYTDTILQDTIAGKGEFFVEPARNGGNTGGNPNTPDPNVLTDEDRKVIAKMNISEKTYLDIIKGGGPNMGGALSNKTSF